MVNVKVSVVLPNYNHAKYLAQRIESILAQSFENFELILLDDCSTDNSKEIISHYASQDSRIKVTLNEKNSGSTFHQWNKGIALARGEYVWIAESDDYADLNFLKVLVNKLDNDPKVGLVYCDSYSVDEVGNILEEMKYRYCKHTEKDLWMSDFTWDGIQFISYFMPFVNVIPNASAVLLRRSILNKVGLANNKTRLAGDWLYWISLLTYCDVSYVSKPYNYFRTHTNNVRSKTASTGILLEESSMVLLKIKESVGDTNQNRQAGQLLLERWFNEFVYGKIPAKRNLKLFKNFNKIFEHTDKNILNEWSTFILSNKMSGARMIIGDKYLYRLFPKLRKS